MMIENAYALAEEDLVRQIANRVVQKLQERQKQALVVFTGSNLGAQQARESLRALKQDGYCFSLLFTHSAARMFDVKALGEELDALDVWTDDVADPRALASRFNTIIVPALTVYTASQLAACLPNTPVAATLFNAFMKGKTVVMAIDGCCPDNPERKALGYAMADPLKERLRSHFETLRAFGAKLTVAQNLQGKVKRASTVICASGSNPQAESAVAQPAGTGAWLGKVLGAAVVRSCAPHSELRVSAQTLITHMAQDEARLRDVRIIKAMQG